MTQGFQGVIGLSGTFGRGSEGGGAATRATTTSGVLAGRDWRGLRRDFEEARRRRAGAASGSKPPEPPKTGSIEEREPAAGSPKAGRATFRRCLRGASSSTSAAPNSTGTSTPSSPDGPACGPWSCTGSPGPSPSAGAEAGGASSSWARADMGTQPSSKAADRNKAMFIASRNGTRGLLRNQVAR